MKILKRLYVIVAWFLVGFVVTIPLIIIAIFVWLLSGYDLVTGFFEWFMDHLPNDI
jgi:hypothetical protein